MRLRAFGAALAVLSASVTSSAAQAPDNAFDLELNNVKPTANGCRVTFVAINNLGTRLDSTAIEIGVFDANNIFSEMVVFDFGRLPSGKTKVVQYDLHRPCDTIGRLLLNSIKDCKGEKDMKQECEDRIKTRSRANIAFGQ
jgi:hypothetical protein